MLKIPTSIHLYQEGNLEGLNIEDLGRYLEEKTHIPFHIHGNIYERLSEKRVGAVAKEFAGIKVKDPGKRFTPLENSTIYVGDVERKCSFVIEGGVKAPSFLTGFIPGVPLQAEIDYEKRRMKDPQWRIFGILYEGVWYQKIVSEIIHQGKFDFNRCTILFTNQLFGTWDRGDLRYHARVSLYAFPNLISTTGLVEAPAKPKGFYLKKQMGVSVELLEEEYQGRFLDHGDVRTTEILKGYAMQALFFHLSGEPFCEDPDCRLFNSHWQEEVLHAQLDGRYEFCPKHEGILSKVREQAGLRNLPSPGDCVVIPF
jgi:hypothetical protein